MLVNRRIFLRGLGGACVAAPFLGSLGARSVRAADVAAPRRWIAMFTHNGCITNRFFPDKSHGVLTAEELAPTTLAPLSPFVSKLLIPRGIRGMNEWSSPMNLGQGNDPFTQVNGSYFTCQPVTPNSDDPFSFDTATKFNAKPIGPSLDHVIAQQLSPGGAPLFMRVGNGSDSPQSGISYSAATTAYPGLGNVTTIWSSLTGLFADAPLSADSYQAIRGKNVLDLVKDDLESLQRFDMSQADRNKLEAWKSLLSETTPVMRSAQCNSTAAADLGLTAEAVNALSAGSTGDVLGTRLTSRMDGADVYSSLAVLAALCNANPVIFLKYPWSYIFKSLGMSVDHTSLSQRTGNAAMAGPCVTGVNEMLVAIDDYLTQKFAYLVGLLDGIDEGEGTLLDNCAAVWFHDVSDGSARNLNNLPIIQAGGAGGYFRTGCTVNVEDGTADLSRGNSEATCGAGTTDQADGVNKVTGTDPKVANAPINKYYCNLMNALGVKAGTDGFPAVGGTAEVTHFGRYDRTEDFVGGGTATPAIHSPGEYDALKASS